MPLAPVLVGAFFASAPIPEWLQTLGLATLLALVLCWLVWTNPRARD